MKWPGSFLLCIVLYPRLVCQKRSVHYEPQETRKVQCSEIKTFEKFDHLSAFLCQRLSSH